MGTFKISDEVTPSSHNAWKPEQWESITGEVTFVGTSIGDNFEKTAKVRQLRVDILQPSGVPATIWAVVCSDINDPEEAYADRLARAIAKAVEDAVPGGDMSYPGSHLTVQRLGDIPPSKPGYNPAKDFVATFQPPTKGVELGQLAAQYQTPAPPAPPAPVAQQAPMPAPVAQVPPVAPQPVPQMTQGGIVQPQAPQTVAAIPGETIQPLPQAIQPPPVAQVPQPVAPSPAEALGVPQHVLDAMTPEQVAALQAQQAGGAQAQVAPLVQPPQQ